MRQLLLLLVVGGCSAPPSPQPDLAMAPAWRRFVTPPGNQPRWGMPIVAFAEERRFVGFGGSTGIAPVQETWSFSLRDESWTRVLDVGSPTARVHHCAAALPAQNQMLIVGGAAGGGVLLDEALTYEVGTRRWDRVTGDGPGAQEGCTATFLPALARAIVFGGTTARGQRSDETWLYDPATREFSLVSVATRPPGRADASLILDGNTLLLAGGLGDGNQRLDDTWRFDGTSWSPVEEPRPPTRAGALFASDATRAVLFGGSDADGPRDDLWLRSAGEWRALSLDGDRPSPRRLGSAALDTTLRLFVIFGGTDADGPLADGWALSLP